VRNHIRGEAVLYYSENYPEISASLMHPQNDNVNLGHFANYIVNGLSTSDEYLGFMGGREPVGSLVLAAQVFKKNIRVWQKENRELKLATVVKGDPSSHEFVDMLHSGAHFDRLVEVGDLVTKSQALDVEREAGERILESQRKTEEADRKAIREAQEIGYFPLVSY
jgi:hypothetical protein